jgi:hypothetical protein
MRILALEKLIRVKISKIDVRDDYNGMRNNFNFEMRQDIYL